MTPEGIFAYNIKDAVGDNEKSEMYKYRNTGKTRIKHGVCR